MSVKDYIAKIQNSCALHKASGSTVPKVEKVKIILVKLLLEVDAV